MQWWLDALALLFFLGAWGGYSFLSYMRGSKSSLVKVMHRYRIQWIKHMIRREERLVDIRIIGNLLKTSTFLASTSVIIVAGAITIIGFGSQGVALFNRLPFIANTTIELWLIKGSLLVVIFIYSFFKLTWVIRQLNYAAVLIVAAPVYYEGIDNHFDIRKSTRYVSKTATMLSNAGRHFNSSIRAYYFGMVATSWYVSPIFFIVMTLLVVMVLYRREFMSKTLVLLS